MTPRDIISPASPTQLLSDANNVLLALNANSGPVLYIVSTPIGNLRDITLRALDILHGCAHILAEDTRQTAKLLDHYNINTSLSAYHDHNATKRIPYLVEKLTDGAVMALVSDAGTPLISDPGYNCGNAALAAGVQVVPAPGASAVLAALTLSGLPSDRFAFGGFLPPKSAARRRMLETYKNTDGTLIFFESAPRLIGMLEDMTDILGDRPVALARELTKRYEEARRGRISEILEDVKVNKPKGEIVLCVGPSDRPEIWGRTEIMAALPDVVKEQGVKRASEYIASLSGWTKRDIYKIALSLKDGS